MPPHWIHDLLSTARSPRVTVARLTALLVLPACSRPPELLVQVDSASAPYASEVLALPFNPSSLVHAARSSGDATDSIGARYAALADSASSADAHFQRERTELNRQAIALHREDRRARPYSVTYDAFQRRRVAALRLRETRDRLRVRLAALHRRYPDRLPANGTPLSRTNDRGRLRSALDSAAGTTGRSIVRSPLARGSATLRLPDGVWWIALAGPDGAPHAATRITASPGVGATLRLP